MPVCFIGLLGRLAVEAQQENTCGAEYECEIDSAAATISAKAQSVSMQATLRAA